MDDIEEVMSDPSNPQSSAPNPEHDLKDAQLDEASASNDQGFGTSGILSGGIGNLTQTASHVVSIH